MTAQARRLRNGLLRPWVVDYMAGAEELDQLQAQGLTVDLDPDQAHALGVAIAEQRGEGHEPAGDLTPSAKLMVMIEDIAQGRERPLDQGHGLDQDQDQDQDQRLTPDNRTARAPAIGVDQAKPHGQGEHHSGTRQRNQQGKLKGRNPLRDYPDEEWTP